MDNESTCSCRQDISKDIFTDHNHSHGHGDEHEEKFSAKKIILYAIGVFLFITALLLPKDFPYTPIFYIVSYICIGAEVVLTALKNISKGDFFDEFFLMSVATIGALLIKEYPEAVAVMIFYQIGEYLSDRATAKSKKSIKELMNIKPEFANLIIEGETKKVSPQEVQIGDIILIKPGEKIPLDSVVIEGKSQIDASALIGESVPRTAGVGDEILSGSINLTGLLKAKVTSKFENSTVAKILNLVQNASEKKAPVENFITTFSKVYTPIVVFAALALAILPPIFLGDFNFSPWIYRALVFLVVSCPCALVVSVPLTMFSGIGAASSKGILVKGGNYLQELSKIETVVFDKTGTLTQGVFKVVDVIVNETTTINEAMSKEEILKIAYSLEKYSDHPIGKSIVNHYEKNILLNQTSETVITSFEDLSGFGVKALFEKETVLAGNKKLMELENINYTEHFGAGTVVYIAQNKKYLGAIIISDVIKDDAKIAIENLTKLGVKRIVMLTGDRKKQGEDVAKELGISQVLTELLPQEKIEKLEEMYKQNPNEKIAFVGDGINDAPSLIRSNVGIAMGGVGSAAAIEASDIVIMTDEPSKVALAIKTSRNIMKIAKQNIFLALSIKGLVLILATFGLANMWLAVFADVGVTVLAVLNSMRKK